MNTSTAESTNAGLPRSGGRILVEALRINGVDTVFCVPGESYLEVLDALIDTDIRVIVARHEGAAANMAEADGKLPGSPGICIVTRGPGATHASVGVHTAMQDSTPMILFIGQVDRPFRSREAFQEVEYRQMFAPLAIWVAEIDDPKRIPEFVARAFQVATSGRPGPVVLALPGDMLKETCVSADVQAAVAVTAIPSPDSLEALQSEFAQAQRPLMILGGSGWTDAACRDIAAFAEAHGLPVAAGFRRQHLFDNDHAHYAGHLGLGLDPNLAATVRDADLLLVLGSRLSEVTSQSYALIEAPRPRQRLIHAHADANELGSVYRADLLIHTSMPDLAAALAQSPPNGHARIKDQLRDWLRQARANFTAFTHPPAPAKVKDERGVDLSQAVAHLSAVLPADAIVCNGAGNYTAWVHRYYRYRQFRSQLAPTSGAMGYGLPAAIAAKLRFPERTVVCFAGDGCFLMYPQELATACQSGAAVIGIVANNGMYGTIRMHQERHYPGRSAYTGLRNPDFAALAQSFGAYAERIDNTEEFAPAFERARQCGKPALLELRVDPLQLTPAMRLKNDPLA